MRYQLLLEDRLPVLCQRRSLGHQLRQRLLLYGVRLQDQHDWRGQHGRHVSLWNRRLWLELLFAHEPHLLRLCRTFRHQLRRRFDLHGERLRDQRLGWLGRRLELGLRQRYGLVRRGLLLAVRKSVLCQRRSPRHQLSHWVVLYGQWLCQQLRRLDRRREPRGHRRLGHDHHGRLHVLGERPVGLLAALLSPERRQQLLLRSQRQQGDLR